MTWGKIRLSKVLRQYRIECIVKNNLEYKQVTISKYNGVSFRGIKMGNEIGRKRQFVINLSKHPNTLMFVRQGVKDGAIGIAREDVNGCIATENMPMFSIENINAEFLEFVINTNFFKNELSKLSTTGSAQKSIHERQLLQIEIPYPPIDEQEKIVTILKIRKNTIANLQEQFDKQIILNKKLRHQILQDAVQGKLVPQDPSDEPASKLLERIKEEKERLIREKKIKKDKPLPPIKVDEIPFEIPEGWVWCRLGEIAIISSGIALGKNYSGELIDYPYLRVANVQRGYLDLGIIKTLRLPKDVGEKYLLKPKDILVNEGGDFDKVGRSALWEGEINDCIHQNHIFRVTPILSSPKYLELVLNSNSSINYFLGAYKKSTNLASINKTKLTNLPVLLPPIDDQNRIVKRIKQLFFSFESIDQNIIKNEQLANDLLAVALREALEPKLTQNSYEKCRHQ
jgi:type I restriction enzyme, S subunit